MSKASRGDTVKVHYTGTLADGSVFDTTAERGPMTLVVGNGLTLQNLEEAIIGMASGEKKTVHLQASHAFGRKAKNMERVMRRDQLPAGTKVKRGQTLRLTLADGRHTIFTVTRVLKDEIMYDANHPLAGQDLTFEIELLDICQD